MFLRYRREFSINIGYFVVFLTFSVVVGLFMLIAVFLVDGADALL